MADWTDFLEDLSAGAAGITSGLTAGMKPFEAWENVRTKDLANDKSDIALRDLYYQQMANEELDGYYGNAAASRDSAYRKTSSGNEVDIFGNQQKLDMGRYFSDPNGYFQMTARMQGLEPGSPEYRAFLAEQMAQFDPRLGVSEYDKFKIPELQNRNLNDQAIGAVLLGWAQQKDPNATVKRNLDGTYSIISNGEETHIAGDVLTKIATMTNAKDPGAALSAAYKDEIGIQDSNTRRMTSQAAVIKAMQEGRITPAAAAKYYQEQRVSANQILIAAQKEMQQIANEAKTSMWTAEETEARMGPARENFRAAQRTMQETQQMLQRILATGRVPGMQMGGGPGDGAPRPRVAPQGGASMTTRPRPGGLGAQAGGGGGGSGPMPPWGRSSEGPGYGRADNSAAPLSPDELMEYLQAQGLG